MTATTQFTDHVIGLQEHDSTIPRVCDATCAMCRALGDVGQKGGA